MNIGEIARRAGVSRSTVSYALSGKRTVSEATRQRINQVVEELDFRRSAELVAAGYGPARRALAGFTDAVSARSLQGADFCCPDDAAGGEACITEIRAAHPEITAVATINEAALPGVQRGLETAGLAVPRDFSITGVAARHWAEDLRPPLTAAEVPTLEMGANAVELLLERIASPQAQPRHILLAPPISLRASTGPWPGTPRVN